LKEFWDSYSEWILVGGGFTALITGIFAVYQSYLSRRYERAKLSREEGFGRKVSDVGNLLSLFSNRYVALKDALAIICLTKKKTIPMDRVGQLTGPYSWRISTIL